MQNEEHDNLMIVLKKAAAFHGHLGPFLAIGVRMGLLALERFAAEIDNHDELQTTVMIPLRTPFSCIIDGIQTTTLCTIGNRKLKVNATSSNFSARFKSKATKRKVTISLQKRLLEELQKELTPYLSDLDLQKLALRVAAMSEEHLFSVKDE